jgi:NADH:ubiquinone oxidoreductase subunit E
LIFDDLRAIQSQYGYLPAEQLEALSKKTGTPLYRIHGVADFYPHFHLSPQLKVRANICTDMSCHLRGADALRMGLKQHFRGMSEREVSVGEVSCLGQCDGAPAVSINDHNYRNVNSLQAEALVLTAFGREPDAGNAARREKDGTGPRSLPEFAAVRRSAEVRSDQGLRRNDRAVEGQRIARPGRRRFPHRHQVGGGAQRTRPGKVRVCNAEESEPGTIKDRFIMEHLPHIPATPGPCGPLCRRGVDRAAHQRLGTASLEEDLQGMAHAQFRPRLPAAGNTQGGDSDGVDAARRV